MQDDRTAHLGLPLPHAQNTLDEDLPRLRQAFAALDENAASQAAAVPIAASQADVDAGELTGKFVSPATLAGTKIKAAQIDGVLDIGNVPDEAVLPAATQAEVDAGQKGDAYVSPVTLAGTAFDAAKITGGVLDMARIPLAAVEDMISVNSDAERYALTAASVHIGKSVRVLGDLEGKDYDPPKLYIVVDMENLANASGYREYAVAVNWDSILDKPSGMTADSFKTAGTTTATGFKLANDTDLAAIFAKSVTVATSGSGAFVKDVAASLSSGTLTITKTLGAGGYCSYCSYCSHCVDCNCSND